MNNYLGLLNNILMNGELRQDRTGYGTKSLFGTMLTFDLQDGFPAVTTKKLAFKQMCAELTCFLRGYDTLPQFHSVGCTIWDANFNAPSWQAKLTQTEKDSGYLGQIYGVLWRRWPLGNKIGTDQLQNAVDVLKKDPWSRRALVTSWNPDALACLPACHTGFQFSIRERNGETYLACAVTMRSVDTFLGMPFNIASYALLTHLCAKELGVCAGRLTMTFGDTHIYTNHFSQVLEQLLREERPLPRLHLDEGANINSFEPSMAHLIGYDPHPSIVADMNT